MPTSLLATLIVLPAAAAFHAGVAAPRPSLAGRTCALPHAHARAAAPRLDFGGPKYKMDAEQGEGAQARVNWPGAREPWRVGACSAFGAHDAPACFFSLSRGASETSAGLPVTSPKTMAG